jgi:hypothetical protein
MSLICRAGKDGSTCQNTPTSCNHSRASSLAEETSNGYVPMAPVDMDPIERYHNEGEVNAVTVRSSLNLIIRC